MPLKAQDQLDLDPATRPVESTPAMDLKEMLGFDPSSKADQHALRLVEEDEAMLRALVAVREAKGLSQTKVAELLGVSPSTVSRLESGSRDLHQSTLRRYAFAVGAIVRHDVCSYEADEGWAERVKDAIETQSSVWRASDPDTRRAALKLARTR